MMSCQKLLLQQITLNLLLALTIVQPSLAAVLRAESSGDTSVSLKVLEYEPPPRGAPGDRGDGGRRDPYDLVAMIPATNFGLTATEYPTFWLYVPTPPTSPIPVELVLRNEQQDEVYKTTFELVQGAGIVSFRLPETAPPLEIGKKYHWFFFCGNSARHGWVERFALKPELSSQLETATPRERILLFAKNGLWYETLTELAELRHQLNQLKSLLEKATTQERILYEALTELDAALDADWAALLKHPFVRLDKIVSEPLLL